MVTDRVKSFERLPAASIRPNPKNWRKHPAAQSEALQAMLDDVGFAGAVLVREVDGGYELIDGHLRLDLMDGADVPAIILDVTEEEADRLLATIDPLAAMAEADAGALSKLLEGFETDNEALGDLLKDLQADCLDMTPLADAADVEPQIDKSEELREQWQTEAGQVWEIIGKSRHRLMCGDSTEADSVSRMLAGEVPFIMVTDPPYGVDYDPNWRADAAATGALWYAPKRAGVVDNDDRLDWTDAYRLFPGAVAYVWHAGRFAADLVLNLRDAGMEIRTQIIWRKPHLAISRGHYHWQHEPCWYAVRTGTSAKWCGDRSQSTVWEIGNRLTDEEGKTDHGTQKPLECMARPIRNHGDSGDHVYDPFLGSGTTMLAAERLGRRCFGMEISPAYCAVILQRMKDAGCECKLET